MLEVKLIAETALQFCSMGKQHTVFTDALRCLHAIGEIPSREYAWADFLLYDAVKEKREPGDGGHYIKGLTVSGELADSTVLWLRQTAAEAAEPFSTYIQQAAECLHDYWSALIDGCEDAEPEAKPAE